MIKIETSGAGDALTGRTAPSRTNRVPRRTAHRGRRVAAGLFVLSVPLGYVAQQSLGAWGERSMAQRFQNRHRLAEPPSVSIEGAVPGWQVAVGSLDDVRLSAAAVPASGARVPVTLTQVSIRAGQVERTGSGWRAERAGAQVFVSYADLSRALGIDLTSAGEGRARVRASVPVVGQVGGTTAVRLAGPTSIALDGVHADGEASLLVQSAIGRLLQQPLHLDEVPTGLRLTTVRLEHDGLHADLSGTGVTVDA